MRRTAKRSVLTSILFLALAAFLTAAVDTDGGYRSISAEEFLGHVKFLASGEMKGRGNGTPELDRAAEYIAYHFRRLGLKPAIGDSYFQPFQVTTRVDLGLENALSISSDDETFEYRLGQDYLLLSIGRTKQIIGEIVFAGYGITASEHNYDDYQDLDARGKIVLALDHEPGELNENSPFDGKANTHHASLESKAINAKHHGAQALLIVSDVNNHPNEPEDFATQMRALSVRNLGIAAFRLKMDLADALLRKAKISLRKIQEEIDSDFKPRSQPLRGLLLQARVDAKPVDAEVKNVIGWLPGDDPKLRDEYVIVGAHYDHIGLGDGSSLAPEQVGQIHHGADDNASGTAGVLELAKAFARTAHKRSLVFICFAGEELGLLGSSYYTRNPPFPLERTVAMINLDMIGRPKQRKVYVGGEGTSPAFKGIVEDAGRNSGLEIQRSGSGYAASDHTSFYVKGIPILFFFSGLHGDYHKPSDVWDKIDAESAEKLLKVVYLTVKRIDENPERPAFQKTRDAMPIAGGRGYGPYFGSVPDFAEDVKGVRFADIRAGSPAEKAGLRAGDILIEFDGKPIENLQDFTYALRSKRPGDEVVVVIVRDGKKVKAKVTLAERR